MEAFDVVILGGGVAGCATALSLKQHDPALSVAILERGTFDPDQPRIGETLPPHTLALFQQLGLGARLKDQNYVPAYGTCAVWGTPDLHHNEFFFSPSGYGWHLDRQAFDAWLAQEAAGRGAVLLTETRLMDHQRTPDGWTLTVQQAGEARPLKSRFMVDATGRLAVFARQQGAQKRVFDQLVAFYRFLTFDTPPDDTATLVEAAPEGWWYSALLPGGRVVAALMTDADLARAHRLREPEGWEAWLDQTQHTRMRLAGAAEVTAPLVAPAHSQRLDPPCGDRWLAAGDAASTFDPLSSLGIFKALRTGIFASYAILDHFKGEARGLTKYARIVETSYRAYLDTRGQYYRQEQRWPEATFWQRRHQPLTADLPETALQEA